MEENLTRGLTKFNGSDFLSWKLEITQLLIAHGLEDLIDGTREKPPGERTSQAVKSWTKDNAKAMSIISMSMERKQLQSLITCTTAREMWQSLTRTYEQKSASSKLLLLQRYHEHRMNSSDSVVQHVTNVQNLASQLKDAGQTIDETDIMAKILGSLPAKYNTLVTAWDSVPTESQTVGVLLERLIKEENKLTTEDDTTSAFAVTSSNKRKTGQQTKHTSRKNKTTDSNKSNVECHYCKKKGHYIRERKKDYQDKTEKKTSDSAFLAETSPKVHKQLQSLVLSSENTAISRDLKEIWITDSGASRHITYRRHWLHDLQPREGDTVSLGDDGQCAVKGVGTVHIEKLINGKWIKARIENVLYVPSLKKNLFSVGVCTTRGYKVLFSNKEVILTYNNTVEAKGVRLDNNI